MEASKDIEIEVLKVHRVFWESYAQRDIELRFSLCSEDITFIGSGLHERASNRTEYKKINQEGVKQFPDHFQIEFLWIQLTLISESVACVESEVIWSQLIKNETSKELLRNTTVLKYDNDKWLVAHVHGSVPDYRLKVGDYMTNEQTVIRNIELERQVFERTHDLNKTLEELEQKNRELEIETALEKVRSSALAMKEPEDMLEVCQIISDQLNTLNVEEIRNVQTAIFNESKGTYLNYEFYSKHNKTFITEVDYKTHEIQNFFANQMLNGAEELFTRSFKEKEVKDWYAYQKTTNQFADPFLETAESLSYYWYSLGPVALGMSTYLPLNGKEIILFKRFRNVFELAYRRFIDIQQAEAQAREAQIELALERVRASTMAMQKSEELKEVIQIVYEQFVQLNIHVEHAGFIMDYKARDDMNIWLADKHEVPLHITIPYFDSPHWNSFNEAKEKEIDFFANHLTFEEKNKFYQDLFQLFPVPDEAKEYYFGCPGLAISTVLLENVGLYIENFSGIPFTEEENKTLMRFGKVFQQTYTRFLDLQKAEAQTREAKIEAALERTRTQSMLMQHSNELNDISKIFHEQLLLLGIDSEFSFVWLPNEEKDEHLFWTTWANDVDGAQQFHSKAINYPMDKTEPYTAACFAAWESDETVHEYYVRPEEIENFFKSWEELLKGAEQFKPELFPEGIYYTEAYMKYGCFGIDIRRKLAADEKEIIRRFAVEFERTYTRFLDLKKAEAQAREAKIEACLEKVRTVALSLKKSDEMLDIAQVLYEQLLELGFTHIRNAIIDIHNDKNETFLDYDYSHDMGRTVTLMSYYDDPIIEKQVREIESSSDAFFEIILEGQDLQDLIDIRLKNGEAEDPRLRQIDQLTYNLYSFGNGAIGISNFGLLSDEQKSVLKRFRNVFTFAYNRYTEMVRSETQAREAQIEVSLERVRSKAMSMHNPEDFVATINTFYKELSSLSFTPRRCGVGLIDKESRTAELSTMNTTGDGDSIEIIGRINLSGHPVLNNVYNNWITQTEYQPVLRGNEIKEYYQLLRPQISFPDFSNDQVQFGYFFFFNEGGVYSWTEKELSEDELQIYRRFTSVLSLTYRRFLELKEAEARALESTRQASLDRVRAEIASMRTSEDLNRITPIIWRELKILEVPFIRCGVFIVDETYETTQVYLTTPDGKSLGVLNLTFDASELTSNTVEYWRKKKVFKEHWSKEEFINWTKSMMEIGQVQNAETYQGSSIPPESLDLHFVPFAQGMLYVGDVSPLAEDKLELVKTLAEAFSIAYARYEDFKNLEDAKNKIEVTLKELKSAQAQLIHSEKMASLGELTAGIAHEIKNPLNFVNNFSELSRELLDEMKVELEKNNVNEVIEIVEDLKQNLEKINQHGKRADSIVKGMLLHSRGTSGEKTLTDINDLLDQYVNLAYHGIRAQNKEFNITIEKDYDKNLEKISIVPQDISRVFLNVINNACYAAYDKKKTSNDSGFSPTLKVSTKNLNGKVEIKIGDNGNGIPEAIKKQIFNPFFTTKPTGEGTGLGLSLSYDIVVKQHSGEIKFESQEGVYTEFIIILPK